MALNGLSPLIIFTFYKRISEDFIGPSLPLIRSLPRIPTIPVPIYLDEQLTGILVDDYSRSISIDIFREGVTSFERVSGDVVNMNFAASKDNTVLTALSALFSKVATEFDKRVQEPARPNYKITLFYDNIFISDASLEQFNTNLASGTNLRKISVQLAKRPEESIADKAENTKSLEPLKRLGTKFGL